MAYVYRTRGSEEGFIAGSGNFYEVSFSTKSDCTATKLVFASSGEAAEKSIKCHPDYAGDGSARSAHPAIIQKVYDEDYLEALRRNGGFIY